jgi:C4-dicarboxylate transporter, DctM subunit
VISVVVYRSVSAGQFYTTLLNSARSTAAVGILIAGALAFNYVITRQDVPASLAMFIQQFDLSPVGFLIAINLLMLALGCVLEGGAILLIIVPIFIPTAQAMGIDLVHFGVVVVVNAMLGLITPPYGLLLFVVANITGQPVGRIIRELLPFLGALFIALGIITFVPDFVLFLPRLLGYRG